jgi:hypothetical protein
LSLPSDRRYRATQFSRICGENKRMSREGAGGAGIGRRLVLGAITALLLPPGMPASAAGLVAIYRATWAGLPAARIRLVLDDSVDGYRDRIEIRTEGLPRLVTHFRGTAASEGRLTDGGEPARYDALYDLRKRHNSHISMRFVDRGGALVAERGPGDTSRKPPLAEKFRRNIVDPLAALERIRAALRNGGSSGFVVPVYDGARRFDVVGRILAPRGKEYGARSVALTLRPIAGFKGESSDDGDPDNAPRPVALSLSNDARLVPLSITVPVWYLPLVIRLERVCSADSACPG